MSSGKNGSRPGSSKQSPDTGDDDQGTPSGPFSLPVGYYEYYGIPLPKGGVKAKRSLYPGRSLPRGYLEYYGIIQPERSDKSEAESDASAKDAEHVHAATDQGFSGAGSALPYLENDAVPTTPLPAGGPAAPGGLKAPAGESEAGHKAAGQGTNRPSKPLPHLDETPAETVPGNQGQAASNGQAVKPGMSEADASRAIDDNGSAGGEWELAIAAAMEGAEAGAAAPEQLLLGMQTEPRAGVVE